MDFTNTLINLSNSASASSISNLHLGNSSTLGATVPDISRRNLAGVGGLESLTLNEISKSNATLMPTESPFNISVRRVHSTMNFIVPQFGPEALDVDMEPVQFLESYSSEDQEKLLIQDLLYSLSGLETPMISTHSIGSNKVGFTVDPRIESSLRDLVLQIASVGGYYFTVTRFVENWRKFELGQVNQALCAAIRTILRDYHVFLAQMESQFAKEDLTLQKLWYFIQPILQKMSCISSIVCAIEDGKCIGGQVLSIIHEKVASMVGNEAGHELCCSLAEQASKPFFTILENWIYKGIIKDPFGDFFITETETCLSEEDFSNEPDAIDVYWEKKYIADLKKCPSFLKKLHNEILKAGKYLNVIQQCGKDIGLQGGEKIVYNAHERIYANAIEQAYSFASKTLLDLLLKDYDLMKRLESVKHYLLMSQGDFIMQFLDLTEDELRKPVEELIETKISSLLELALRTSSLTDPYKDSIKVQLFPFGIREQMITITTIQAKQNGNDSGIPVPALEEFNGNGVNYMLPGFEAFAFSYEVEWPISLVLNYRAIYCYQIIFRHLFFCKHVERQLCRTWIGSGHMNCQNVAFDHTSITSIFSLRHKMLNFVQNLLYYMAFEVIEPAWYIFTTTMSKVQNVDDVLVSHMAFVNTVLSESMLTNQSILDKMTELFRLCLRFSDKCLNSNTSSNISALAHPKVKAGNTIKSLDEKFTKGLVTFLKLVSNIVQNPNQPSKVVNIIHRMNFNSYYTEALEAEGEAEVEEY